MTPATDHWRLLVTAIEEQRAQARRDYRHLILQFVGRLIDAKHCTATAMGWLCPRRVAGGRNVLTWSVNSDTRADDHPALRLKGLTELEDGAVLSIWVETSAAADLLSYSVGLRGERRGSGNPWYARIDLDAGPRGKGPCGHPRLHCHLGGNPGQPDDPRAPLPWISPVHALEWLLTTVHSDFEPSPWRPEELEGKE
jgi:hypothetical protein